jgi:hypothetical protein
MKHETEHQGAETRETEGARHRFETILYPPRVSDHFRHPSSLCKRGWFGTGSPINNIDISHGNTQLYIELGSRDPNPYTRRELAERTPS